MGELEKKFSGKHVVFIAQRRILPKPTRKANMLKQKRPISRTLVAVHTAILDDLVYPAEIRQEDEGQARRVAALQDPPRQEPADQHRAQDGHFRRGVQEVDREGGDLRVSRALLVKHQLSIEALCILFKARRWARIKKRKPKK